MVTFYEKECCGVGPVQICKCDPISTWSHFLLCCGILHEKRVLRRRSPRRRSPAHNHLPRIYKPEIMRKIHSFLHKPRFVDSFETVNRDGKTAEQVARNAGHTSTARLLRRLARSS